MGRHQLRPALRHSGVRHGDSTAWSWTFATTKSGTFNPTITKTGAAASWVIGGTTYVTNTPSVAVSGTTPVTLIVTDPATVTQLAINGQSIVGTLTTAQLAEFTALTNLTGHTNASLIVSGDVADLPSGLTLLYLYNTSSALTGDVADLPSGLTQLHLYSTSSSLTGNVSDLPSGLTQLYLYSTSSALTGDVADLPSGMTILHLYSTSSTLTGDVADLPSGMLALYLHSTSSALTGGTGVGAAGLRFLLLDSTGMNAAAVDALLEYFYTNRAGYTYTGHILNLGGSNADPTGVYQDATPPTTGLEWKYKLVEDPDAEGFEVWTITT